MKCFDCLKEIETFPLDCFAYCISCDEKRDYYHDKVIEQIKNFKKIRSFICCDKPQVSSNMSFYDVCCVCHKNSNKKHFSMSTETYDVLVEAKRWWDEHDSELKASFAEFNVLDNIEKE